MIRFTLRVVLFLLMSLGATLTCGSASEGLTLHQKTVVTGMPMGQAQDTTETTYYSKDGMRQNYAAGTDVIVQFGDQKMILLDHQKKTYSEMTFGQIREMTGRATSELSQQDQVPDATRQMMGQNVGEVTFTDEGPGEEIAGFATQKYRIQMPSLELRLWSAKELPVPSHYYDALRLGAQANPMFDMGKIYDAFKTMEGLAVKTVTSMEIMGTRITTTTTVTSVERGPLPSSTFDVPADYTRTAQPGLP